MATTSLVAEVWYIGELMSSRACPNLSRDYLCWVRPDRLLI